MYNILYISMLLPYKNVSNAGGKTFYYYIKGINEDTRFSSTLIAKCLPGESFDYEDLNNINFFPVTNEPLSPAHPVRSIEDVYSKVSPFSHYGGTLRNDIYRQILAILESGKIATPDIVVLEFTEIVLLAPKIHQLYPKARIVASEHDVSFLGYKRKYLAEKNIFLRQYKKIKYNIRKKNELLSIENCDSVMPHNKKDADILIKNNIDAHTIFVLTPYFTHMRVNRHPDFKSVLFYGAMGRYENYEAAIWFIREVMPKLPNNISLTVLGSNPPDELKKLQSNRVTVTGFVDDIVPYFETATCLVAPLHLGAGVKVKILEAMQAGIPVLTTEIGIEGIYAKEGEDYYKCDTPDEYVEVINKMITGEIDVQLISENERTFMENNYDLKKALEDYKENLVGPESFSESH